VMPPDTFQGIQRVYFDGDMEAAPALAGQSVALIHEVRTAADIIDDMVRGFFETTARLGQMAQNHAFG
jgi:enoyl-[acyl-carrier protein] reductase II